MIKVRRKINVGIIGTGFGHYGLAPAFQLDPRCDVVAIAASSIENAEAYANKMDGVVAATVDDLIASPQIDAIAIATPPSVQYEIARRALISGKAVFAEKPITLNIKDAKNLSEIAHSKGLANVIDFIFPELDTWQTAKKHLDDGQIGTPLHMVLDWRMESYDIRNNLNGWKLNNKIGGGVLSHFGSHSFYYLEWLFGPLTSLSAHLSCAQNSDFNGDTLASLSLQFASGLSGVAILSNVARYGPGHRLEIYGDKGTLQLFNPGPDPVEGFKLAIGNHHSEELETLETEKWPEQPVHSDSRIRPVARLVNRFLNWMETGTAVSPSFKEGARVQELLDAAKLSNIKDVCVRVA